MRVIALQVEEWFVKHGGQKRVFLATDEPDLLAEAKKKWVALVIDTYIPSSHYLKYPHSTMCLHLFYVQCYMYTSIIAHYFSYFNV